MRHIFGCFLSPEKCLPNIVTILKILQLYFLWTNFVADSDEETNDPPPLPKTADKEAKKKPKDPAQEIPSAAEPMPEKQEEEEEEEGEEEEAHKQEDPASAQVTFCFCIMKHANNRKSEVIDVRGSFTLRSLEHRLF